MNLATYTDAHSPKNEGCPHNQNPEQACTCKRQKIRKPYRQIRVHDRNVGHGIRPQLVVAVWPDGRIEIREHKRRLSISVTAGTIYERALIQQALAERRQRRKNRRRSGV